MQTSLAWSLSSSKRSDRIPLPALWCIRMGQLSNGEAGPSARHRPESQGQHGLPEGSGSQHRAHPARLGVGQEGGAEGKQLRVGGGCLCASSSCWSPFPSALVRLPQGWCWCRGARDPETSLASTVCEAGLRERGACRLGLGTGSLAARSAFRSEATPADSLCPGAPWRGEAAGLVTPDRGGHSHLHSVALLGTKSAGISPSLQSGGAGSIMASSAPWLSCGQGP